MLPAASERNLSTRRSTAGWSVESSRQINRPIPSALPAAMATMKRELNQSSSWPCSRKVWKQASPIVSRAIPIQSTGSWAMLSSSSCGR